MTRRLVLAVLAVAAVLPLAACEEEMSSSERICRSFYEDMADRTGLDSHYEAAADQRC